MRPAPERRRMPQTVHPAARQAWAEAFTVRATRLIDVCAHAYGEGARAEIVHAANELGMLARDVLAYARERRHGICAAARARRVVDGEPLDDPVREETSSRRAPSRRKELTEQLQQALYIKKCLRTRRSIKRLRAVSTRTSPRTDRPRWFTRRCMGSTRQ